MDKKIKQKDARMGKNMDWKWDARPKVENFYQNKVCHQSYNVWQEFGI